MTRVAALGITAATAAFLLLVAGSSAADSFTLTKVAETSNTITFSYPQQSGYGYLFTVNDSVVSRTYDASRTSVRFSKVDGATYGVKVLTVGAEGSYTETPPPPPPPPPPPAQGTISQNIPNGESISGVGQWTASYSGPQIASVQFFVDATLVVTDTTSPYGGTWDSTDTPDGAHTMSVKAVDPSGNVLATSTVNVTFANGNGGDTGGGTPPNPPPPPPPPSGNLTTISPSQFNAMASSGATVSNVHVTGSIQVNSSNVTLSNCVVDGTVDIYGNGFTLQGCTIKQFNIWGADNITIDRNTVNGNCQIANNQIWDVPAGNVPTNITITNNLIENFFVCSNSGTHSEGIYLGYSNTVLIQGNDFENNGNTGHIFFTYWGSTANPAVSYPRNICVKGNTFGPTRGAYVDVNFRQEIPTSANIKVQRDATSTSPQFYGDC